MFKVTHWTVDVESTRTLVSSQQPRNISSLQFSHTKRTESVDLTNIFSS